MFVYSEDVEWDTVQSLGKRIQDKYDGKFENLTIYASGTGVFAHAINTKIADDLKLSEAISIPLTFILLVFVFGGLVASAMPLLVGVSAILGSFLIIYLLTLFTGVSVFALNLITGLGLGLGIATQRITYLDTSILAQIGSYFVGRLPRVSDRQKITEGFGI
ncbi:MAG: hypothetical protein RL232_152 [Actinomycetota bacterium]